jgi:hypothetical protein
VRIWSVAVSHRVSPVSVPYSVAYSIILDAMHIQRKSLGESGHTPRGIARSQSNIARVRRHQAQPVPARDAEALFDELSQNYAD